MTKSKVTLNARPNLNGNTKDDFRQTYRDLTAARDALEKALVSMSANVLHGRNYQHREDAFAAQLQDEQWTASMRRAYTEIERLKEALANTIA